MRLLMPLAIKPISEGRIFASTTNSEPIGTISTITSPGLITPPTVLVCIWLTVPTIGLLIIVLSKISALPFKLSLKGLEDEYKRNITMLEIAKEEYKLISNLVKKGLESKLEGIRSLKELNQTTGKVESLKTQIEQIKEEIRELEYKKSAIKEEKVAVNLEELSVEESSLLLLKEHFFLSYYYLIQNLF